MTCGTCIFHAADKQQCRKNAPVPLLVGVVAGISLGGVPNPIVTGAWPPVNPDDWCGEWKAGS